ncbi:type III-B CRISPR module RAMP protein Cmr1 [Paenibacillus sonchi]|uniref:type III-B CRISPR module RAMP protein Cmr1 n=1 Tax=Paenibacillus sonchi TaxID=373687 RepID=UPI001E63BCDB|nr:type III-B CRISPR module RAMP protein Cmr1 [Paenibacillus sonchi]
MFMDPKKKIKPPALDLVIKDIQESRKKVPEDRFNITIITPMFGGGSKPGFTDSAFPIRSASIRGHLRFWWRATRGAVFESVTELRQREVEIFGDSHSPSRVKISVHIFNKTEPEKGKEHSASINNETPKRTVRLPRYAVFPFDKNNPGSNMQQFELTIRYTPRLPKQADALENGSKPFLNVEQLRKEITPALWAWINFGGLGSRTRRGCGSLYCKDFAPERTSTRPKYEDWFHGKVADYELELDTQLEKKEWPTLSRSVIIQENERDMISAWNDVIKLYHNFRSQPNNTYIYSKPPKYERSLWPEADSLRRITDMFEEEHKKPSPFKKQEFFSFPRAQLGLPIIFQFKQDEYLKKRYSNFREPYNMQLAPKDKNRLASPLITKVLARSEKRGVGIIVKLNQPRLSELELKVIENKEDKRNRSPRDFAHIESIEKLVAHKPIREKDIYKELSYPGSPMKQGQKSAIQAFLESEEVKEWKRTSYRPNPKQK